MFFPAPKRLACILWPILAVLLILTGFQQAVNKNMHHYITWGAYQDFESMAVAISDLRYNLNAGYLAYAEVINLFNSRLGMNSREGERLPEQRAGDAAYINEVIRDAMTIPQISIISPVGVSDFMPLIRHQLTPVLAEDVGRADYYKTAFRLFGYRVQSTHYLFFVILTISTVLFLIGFHRRPDALFLLVAYLAGLNLLVNSRLFNLGLPSVSSEVVLVSGTVWRLG